MDLLGISGLAVGALGVAVAIASWVFPVRGRAQIKCLVTHHVLIGSKGAELPEEIKIFYRDRRVPQVSKTVIALWSSGQNSIKKGDLVTGDCLRFSIPNGTILQWQCFSSREVNGVDIVKKDDRGAELQCNFEFLDKNDGFRLEVLHTSDQIGTMMGSIVGMPQGFRNMRRLYTSNYENISTILLLFIIAVFISATELYSFFSAPKHYTSSLSSIIPISVALILFTGAFINFYFFYSERIPRKLRD